jgi:thiol:disulfide interchange protein
MHVSSRANGEHFSALWIQACAGIATLLCCGLLFAAPIKTPHAEVELIAEQNALVSGKANTLGLSIKHAPHWHTYWKNPGDSGYPTKVTWQLPQGFTASDFEWPTPKRLPTGPIINFGYEGNMLLPFTLTVPNVANAANAGGGVTIKGKAEWLVCKDVCIPEEGDVSLNLNIVADAASASASANAALFASTRASLPGDANAWKATLHAPPNAARDAWLAITAPANVQPLAALDVFPVPEQITNPAVQTVYKTAQGYAVKLALVDGAKLPERMAIVLAGDTALTGDGKRAGETIATVTNAAFALPGDAKPLAQIANRALTSPAGGDSMSLAFALVFAFVGGMILNLMPCVFPVLSLKILSFAHHAGEQGNAIERRGAMRAHGVFYAIGVIVSFVALASVLLVFKGAGDAVGWGFQLQNPGVIWVLAVIFFLIGLNLMGAFEVGQFAPSSLLSLQAKRPGVDAFFSGVLAVIAASPCTAPFMGAALGFALTQNAFVSLLVFAALGAGMALPYVLLAWFPKWLNRLPRPGPWMVTLKQALAFPMFLTVVWLVWVLSMQAGVDGAAIVMMGLVGLAFAAWLLGSLRGSVRVAGALAALAAVVLAWPTAMSNDANAASAASAVNTGNAANAGASSTPKSTSTWLPWNEAQIATLNAEGKTVFVDFTAAWCVSCQANKRLVLTRSEIVDSFAKKNVVLMRADWTNKDERITKALAAMNRSGVPVYVFYAPGKSPQLLPELLTTGVVKEALARL